MPNLAYHSALPFDFWDLLVSLSDVLSKAFWYLTAFLASSPIRPNGGPGLQVASPQYLLGLGECFILVWCCFQCAQIAVPGRHW